MDSGAPEELPVPVQLVPPAFFGTLVKQPVKIINEERTDYTFFYRVLFQTISCGGLHLEYSMKFILSRNVHETFDTSFLAN